MAWSFVYTWIYGYGVYFRTAGDSGTHETAGGACRRAPCSLYDSLAGQARDRSSSISLVAAASHRITPCGADVLGVFPGSESFLFLPFLFGSVFAGNAIEPVTNVVADSQLTDICDDHELKTGVRAEGVIFSVRTFSMKATAGFGGLIGGIALEIIGFPQDAGAKELAPEVIDGLLFISGPFYFLIFAVGALFMGMYRLNEKRHAEIQALLEERRGANDPA